MKKVKTIFHVLAGRPTLYKVDFKAPLEITTPGNLLMVGCNVLGDKSNPLIVVAGDRAKRKATP